MAVTQVRKDIQGLRAFAVLLVVAGHLFPALVKGGFIGVDIFFVISGFVITQQMLKNYLISGKGFLLNFYARRIRRILPSALLVTITTIWATHKFLGPVASNNANLDGGWATIFLSNFHFQTNSLDYFAAGTQVSPLQHFWSLSIEEQFYLLWPTLFILIFITPISLKVRQVLLGVVIVFSLLSALYQSMLNTSPIFFSTWTRIWELAAGALLAITSKSLSLPKFIAPLLMLLIAASALVIPQSMQWPRTTTVPIILATLILLVRNPRVSTFALLENRVATYIGDLSYIIYLWHWPVLTITKGYCASFGPQEILLVIGITAALSVATHHLYENPLRYWSALAQRPVTTVCAGAVAIAATSLVLFTHYQG